MSAGERVLRAVLGQAGIGAEPASVSALQGGTISDVWLVRPPGGMRLVVKVAARAPAGMYRAEADGLAVLARAGGLRTPAVHSVGPGWLVLEALAPYPDDACFWEEAGRAIARLHLVQGDRFGWEHDGWLGRLTQRNDWCDNGHEFFAAHRILRYLSEPKVEAVLDTASRAALERLCDRLPELIPATLPVLTHGDLWHGNVLAAGPGQPAFIDPAVCWMWAETDLSMMYCAGGPDVRMRFFEGYRELNPLEPGVA